MGETEVLLGFPGGSVVKNLPASVGATGDVGLIPGLRRSPGVGNGNPLQYFLPGKFHGQRDLAGYSPELRRVRHNCSHAEEVHEEVLLVKF